MCFEKNYLIFASIALLTTEIKPQIQHCKPGYKGSFCDKKCTNADLSKQMYTTGCTVACKKGFSLLKGKCTSKSDCHFWISLFCISPFFLLALILNLTCADVLGAPCKIKNSNKKPGKACKCLPFHGGKIVWKGAVATGQCTRLWNDMPHADTLGLQ